MTNHNRYDAESREGTKGKYILVLLLLIAAVLIYFLVPSVNTAINDFMFPLTTGTTIVLVFAIMVVFLALWYSIRGLAGYRREDIQGARVMHDKGASSDHGIPVGEVHGRAGLGMEYGGSDPYTADNARIVETGRVPSKDMPYEDTEYTAIDREQIEGQDGEIEIKNENTESYEERNI